MEHLFTVKIDRLQSLNKEYITYILYLMAPNPKLDILFEKISNDIAEKIINDKNVEMAKKIVDVAVRHGGGIFATGGIVDLENIHLRMPAEDKLNGFQKELGLLYKLLTTYDTIDNFKYENNGFVFTLRKILQQIPQIEINLKLNNNKLTGFSKINQEIYEKFTTDFNKGDTTCYEKNIKIPAQETHIEFMISYPSV